MDWIGWIGDIMGYKKWQILNILCSRADIISSQAGCGMREKERNLGLKVLSWSIERMEMPLVETGKEA